MFLLIFKCYIIVTTIICGGISINKQMHKPTKGYMVGISNHKTLKDMLSNDIGPSEYYGTWVDRKDNNKKYYDISVNVLDYGEAIRLAKKNNEVAIYDVENHMSIYV